MKKYVNYIAAALIVMSMFAGAGIVSAVSAEEAQMVVSAPPMPGDMQELNFTKLEISPRYGNTRLKPGENKEMSVTIKNKEKKSVSIKPSIVIQPYGEYMMEKEWVAVTPETAEIPAGGSQKFTVKVTIPKDASLGYYNTQIAFTDEEIPSPYPQPIPNYVHTYQLSVDVWTPPNVQILRSYITDQLESGKEYDYIIKLKNVADKAIPIDPKMSDQNSMYYGPYGTMDAAFTDDAISITAPKEIPAGQTVEVKVHIKVPEDAKGSYNGAIDLGISDLSVRDEWADMVNLQFGVWKQPSEPFVKSFTTDDASPVTIEVSSNLLNGLLGYIGYPGTTSSSAKTPSFTVGLNGHANEPISLKKTKTLIKGGVSLGGMGTMYPPWESESEGIYNEIGVQYVETFTTNVPKGDLKLSILPRNTQGFEYTITIGE
ncbi:MAG: hypothetical protein KKA10_04640 [Euryarchaeota archaeon]|nr:hypothetical protein [Euryarchaeota archaeon]MCG2735839.1 hypothetical protein [Candidatus Methanoperedenaceae archaeon]